MIMSKLHVLINSFLSPFSPLLFAMAGSFKVKLIKKFNKILFCLYVFFGNKGKKKE